MDSRVQELKDLFVGEAAKLIGISPSYLRELLRRGQIKHFGRRGLARFWLIDEKSLLEWAAQRERRRKGGE